MQNRDRNKVDWSRSADSNMRYREYSKKTKLWGDCPNSECKCKGRDVERIELIRGDKRPKCNCCGQTLEIRDVPPTDPTAKTH